MTYLLLGEVVSKTLAMLCMTNAGPLTVWECDKGVAFSFQGWFSWFEPPVGFCRTEMPNAGGEPRPKAEARNERKL
jgi:hypothetical protein